MLKSCYPTSTMRRFAWRAATLRDTASAIVSRCVRADVFDGVPDGKFDLIVTNPPDVTQRSRSDATRVSP
jgi:methylase of polypeptide subunit release factors